MRNSTGSSIFILFLVALCRHSVGYTNTAVLTFLLQLYAVPACAFAENVRISLAADLAVQDGFMKLGLPAKVGTPFLN